MEGRCRGDGHCLHSGQSLIVDVHLLRILPALVLLLSAGAVLAEDHSGKPKQAMFKTQAEAEAAAPGFGCKGAHRMGDMWMVCSSHGDAGHQGGH